MCVCVCVGGGRGYIRMLYEVAVCTWHEDVCELPLEFRDFRSADLTAVADHYRTDGWSLYVHACMLVRTCMHAWYALL